MPVELSPVRDAGYPSPLNDPSDPLLGHRQPDSLLGSYLVDDSRRARLGFVDKPGGRKIHDNPKPLGGGVAIVGGIVLPLLATLAYLDLAGKGIVRRYADQPYVVALVTGGQHQTPLTLGFVGAIIALHAMGLIDDRKPLGPFVKPFGQIIIAAILVLGFNMRRPAGSSAGRWQMALGCPYGLLDCRHHQRLQFSGQHGRPHRRRRCGLHDRVSDHALIIEQWFVAASLALLLGSLLGFLVLELSACEDLHGG